MSFKKQNVIQQGIYGCSTRGKFVCELGKDETKHNHLHKYAAMRLAFPPAHQFNQPVQLTVRQGHEC